MFLPYSRLLRFAYHHRNYFAECLYISQFREYVFTGVRASMADAFDDSPVVIAELPHIKLFGKWSSEDVNHSDMSLAVSVYTSTQWGIKKHTPNFFSQLLRYLIHFEKKLICIVLDQ